MFEKWIYASPSQLGLIFLSAVCIHASLLVYTRLVGLRSFSKMSATDFVMTIAVGSLFGATITAPSPTLIMGMFAIGCVFVIQWIISILRVHSKIISKTVDNCPLLIMAGSEILHDNLRKSNMTEGDLMAKLREANAFDLDQVLAVIFETTGDVSVLHSADGKVQPKLLEGVVGAEQLFADQGN